MTTYKETNIDSEVAAAGRMAIIPVILEILCRTTRMGFAAVARVTPEKWVACGVNDKIQFGLRAGGALQVDTTICHEIRQNGNAVIIDHVAKDEYYRSHHTPARYGFQSYISIPIRKQDGAFFGTLCAIDPNPNKLSIPAIRKLFTVYAALISLHIDAVENHTPERAGFLEAQSMPVLYEEMQLLFGDDRAETISGPEFITRVSQSAGRVEQFIHSLAAILVQDN